MGREASSNHRRLFLRPDEGWDHQRADREDDQGKEEAAERGALVVTLAVGAEPRKPAEVRQREALGEEAECVVRPPVKSAAEGDRRDDVPVWLRGLPVEEVGVGGRGNDDRGDRTDGGG